MAPADEDLTVSQDLSPAAGAATRAPQPPRPERGAVISQIETLQARERLSRQYGRAAHELHRGNLLAYLRAVSAAL